MSPIIFTPRLHVALSENAAPADFDPARAIFVPRWSMQIGAGRDTGREPRADGVAELGFASVIHHDADFGVAFGIGENQASVADAVQHGVTAGESCRKKHDFFHLMFLRLLAALCVPREPDENNGVAA